MNATAPHTASVHLIERFLAILGAAACIVITALVWRSVSAYQGTWPLPALYFIEVPVLSVISAVAFVRGASFAHHLAWGSVGALGAFCILGAFSVGLLYVPITLIFAAISVTSDVRNKERIAPHLAVCLLAAVAQAALMLAAIRLLAPGAGF